MKTNFKIKTRAARHIQALQSLTTCRAVPPAGQQHTQCPKPLVGPFTDVNRIFMCFETVIQRARCLSPLQCDQMLKKANLIRQPHLSGMENAWEPTLRHPESEIVTRNVCFCFAAYLLSKQTALVSNKGWQLQFTVKYTPFDQEENTLNIQRERCKPALCFNQPNPM